MIKTKTVKDGNRFVTYTYEIDETKPRTWVEGQYYCFNSKLISVEYTKIDKEKVK